MEFSLNYLVVNRSVTLNLTSDLMPARSTFSGLGVPAMPRPHSKVAMAMKQAIRSKMALKTEGFMLP